MNNKSKSQVPCSPNRTSVPMRSIINTFGEQLSVVLVNVAREFVTELLEDITDYFSTLETEGSNRECLTREKFHQLNQNFTLQHQAWKTGNSCVQELLEKAEQLS